MTSLQWSSFELSELTSPGWRSWRTSRRRYRVSAAGRRSSTWRMTTTPSTTTALLCSPGHLHIISILSLATQWACPFFLSFFLLAKDGKGIRPSCIAGLNEKICLFNCYFWIFNFYLLWVFFKVPYFFLSTIYFHLNYDGGLAGLEQFIATLSWHHSGWTSSSKE